MAFGWKSGFHVRVRKNHMMDEAWQSATSVAQSFGQDCSYTHCSFCHLLDHSLTNDFFVDHDRLIISPNYLIFHQRQEPECMTLLRPGQMVLQTQANSSQVHNFDGVGYRLATHLAWVGSSWIELAWIWSSSNFRPTRAKFSTVWPPQANSSQVVLLLLCDYAVVVIQVNGY